MTVHNISLGTSQTKHNHKKLFFRKNPDLSLRQAQTARDQIAARFFKELIVLAHTWKLLVVFLLLPCVKMRVPALGCVEMLEMDFQQSSRGHIHTFF